MWQVPILTLPISFLERLVGGVPSAVREVSPPLRERCTKWIDLADVLSARVPTESTKRTVEYLLELATQALPSQASLLPPLVWLRSTESVDTIDLGMPSTLRKLVPAMHFRASLR